MAGLLLTIAFMGTHGTYAQMAEDPEPVTLISNTENEDDLHVNEVPVSTVFDLMAQPIRTGTASGGYSIDSITLHFSQASCDSRAAGFDFIVEIAEGMASSHAQPSTVADIANSSVLHRWTITTIPNQETALPTTYEVDGTAYTSPKGNDSTTLTRNTTYFVVARVANVQGTDTIDCADWRFNDDAAVHSGAAGWSMPSASQILAFGSWFEIDVENARFRLSISGFELELPAITVAPGATPDEGSPATFTLTRTLDTANALEVEYTITQTAGDMLPTGTPSTTTGTATFSAGSATTMVTIQTEGDDVDEEDATLEFEITASAASPAVYEFGAASTAEITVRDDDVPVLSIANSSATEGNPITFEVRKSIESWQNITVTWALSPDTATSGTNGDYTDDGPDTVTFLPADLTKTFTVPTSDNMEADGNRSFTVTLSNVDPSGSATLDADPTATGTINDDERPTISVSGSSPVTEGSIAEFTITRSGPVVGSLTVPFTVSQTMGDMLPASPNLPMSVEIEDQSATATVTIQTLDDSVHELDAVLRLELSDPASDADYGLGTPSFAEITVSDDDNMPSLTITSPMVTEGEPGDTTVLQFAVEKIGTTSLDVIVDYAISGTASSSGSDKDFTLPEDLRLTIAAADATATIDIVVDGDNLAEADETVIVTLSSPANAMLGSTPGSNVGTGTILNDDLLELSISDARATEGDEDETSTMTFTVTLGAETPATIEVDYAVTGGSADGEATAGEDFESPVSTTLVFSPGDPLKKMINVTVTGDTLPEGDETLTVTLSDPPRCSCPAGVTASIGTGTGIGTIEDNDAPQVTINNPSVKEGDAGETPTLVFEVSLNRAWNEEVRVSYSVDDTVDDSATAETDYATVPDGELSIARNTLRKTLIVTVRGDAEVEEDEKVVITLGISGGGAVFAAGAMSIIGTGTIENDDYSLAIDGPSDSVTEPSSGTSSTNLDFTVTLSSAAEEAVTVKYAFSGTAAEGADFTDTSPNGANGVLTFAPGSTSQIIRARVDSDFVNDGQETVTVTLFEPTVATIATDKATADGTIEPAASTESADTLSVSSPRIAAGTGDGPPVVEFDLILTPMQSSEVTVDWVLNEFTRTATGGEQGAGPFARNVLPPNITVHQLSSGSESVSAGSTGVSVSEPLTAGTTLDGIEGQLVLELGEPSGGVIEIVQESSIENDIQTQASVNGRVAVVVFDASVSGGTSADFATTSAISAFGRSVATGIVDTVWGRAEAHRHGRVSSYASLGGRFIDTSAFSRNAGAAARETARLVGIESAEPASQAASWLDAEPRVSGDLDDFRRWAGLSDTGGIAQRSSFTLALGAGSSGSSIVYWGAGKNDSFGSDLEKDGYSALTSEGSTTAISLGFDYRRNESMLLGLAVSSISGSSEYRFAESSDGKGEVNSSLTSFTPWIRWKSQGGTEFWGAIGIGSGSAEAEHESETVELDLGAQIIAVGLWNQVATFGGMGVAAKADAFTASMSVDGGTDAVDNGDANSQRIRLAAEMSPGQASSGSRRLEYTFELGARSDSGEAASGAGLDAAADFSYVSAGGRFHMSGRGSLVVFHGQEGFSETGLGLGFSYDPDGDSRGFQISLEPTLNASQMFASDSMWEADSAGRRGLSSGEGAAMKARIGYELTMLRGQARVIPYGEAEDGDGRRKQRLGMDFRGTEGSLGRMRLGLYGERRESDSREADNRGMLEGRLSL